MGVELVCVQYVLPALQTDQKHVDLRCVGYVCVCLKRYYSFLEIGEYRFDRLYNYCGIIVLQVTEICTCKLSKFAELHRSKYRKL